MKKTILAIASFLTLTISAHAGYLPILRNPKFFTQEVQTGAFVKTKSFISFVILSCAKREDLKIESEFVNGFMQIKVYDPNPYDCRARGINRDYKLNLGLDNDETRFVLLNPIGVENLYQ